jgi:hypothetical protein
MSFALIFYVFEIVLSSLEALPHAVPLLSLTVSRQSRFGKHCRMGRLGRLGHLELGLALIVSRLQLQGELQAKNESVKKYRGVLHGVKVILQNEGPRGLFRGIGSAVSEAIPL